MSLMLEARQIFRATGWFVRLSVARYLRIIPRIEHIHRAEGTFSQTLVDALKDGWGIFLLDFGGYACEKRWNDVPSSSVRSNSIFWGSCWWVKWNLRTSTTASLFSMTSFLESRRELSALDHSSGRPRRPTTMRKEEGNVPFGEWISTSTWFNRLNCVGFEISTLSSFFSMKNNKKGSDPAPNTTATVHTFSKPEFEESSLFWRGGLWYLILSLNLLLFLRKSDQTLTTKKNTSSIFIILA